MVDVYINELWGADIVFYLKFSNRHFIDIYGDHI